MKHKKTSLELALKKTRENRIIEKISIRALENKCPFNLAPKQFLMM